MDIGECVFCGVVGDLTKEDLISRWAGRLLRKITGSTSILLSMRELRPDGTQPRPTTHRRTQTYSAIKIPRFCATCNNDWMSQIENEVIPVIAPMVLGVRTGVPARDQPVLARWLALKTLTADLIPHEYPVAAQVDFHEFSRIKEPPEGFLARVGHLTGNPDHRCYWGLDPKTASVGHGSVGVGEPTSLQFDFSLGAAWFQTWFAPAAAREFPRSPVRDPSPWWTSVWPARYGVNWPPPLPFTPAHLPPSIGQWPETEAWLERHRDQPER